MTKPDGHWIFEPKSHDFNLQESTLKMKNLYILVLCPILILSACANIGATYEPVVDGVASATFQSDLQACQALARGQHQLDQDTMGSADGAANEATLDG